MNDKEINEINITNFLFCVQDSKEKLNKIIEDVKDLEIKFDWIIDFITKLRTNVNYYANILRNERKEHFSVSVDERLSCKNIEKIDYINEKLNSLKELGIIFLPEDFLYSGYCFYQRDFYEKALIEFNEALSLDYNLLEAYYYKCASLLKLKRYKEALETINNALQLHPDNTSLLLKKMNILYKQNKLSEVINIYDEILSKDPNDFNILLGKANILSKLGRKDEAVELLDRAQAEGHIDRNILLRKINLLSELDRREEAIKAFDVILEVENNAELWLKKAILLSKFGKNKDAFLICQRALEIEPDNVKILYRTSDILTKLDRYEEALEYYKDALSLKPDDPRAWAYMGRLYINLGQYEEAIKSIERSLELKPNYNEALFNKCHLFFEIGEYEKALDIINMILAIKPSSLKALKYKFKLLFRLKRYQELIIVLDKALELSPQDAEFWFLKAIAFVNLNEDEEALKSFEISSRIDPFNCDTWINKAFTLSKINRLDEALKAYDKAIELDPYNSKIWDSRGFVLSKLGNYEEALKSYDRALEIDPRKSRAWDNKGFALSKLGKYEEALKNYDKALELDPSKSKTWDNKGFALSKLERYEEALENYDKALELDPSKPRTWESKGFALSKLERYEDALGSYDKALELAPDRFKTWDNKGFTLLKLKRYEESFDAYNRALKINPHDTKVLFKFSSLLSKLGKSEEALRVLENLLRTEPDNDNLWYEKGLVLSNLGKRDEALQAFARALDTKNRKKTISNKSDYCCTEIDLETNRLDNNESEESIESDGISELEEKNELKESIESEGISELEEKNELEESIESEGISELEEKNELESANLESNYTENSRIREGKTELTGSNSLTDKYCWYDKGNKFLDIENYSEAIESFDKALKVNPNSSKIWFAKGLTICKLLLQVNKDNDRLHTFKNKKGTRKMGSKADKLDNYEEALKIFNLGFKLQSIEKEETYGSVITQLNEYEKIIGDVKKRLSDLDIITTYSSSEKDVLTSEFDGSEKSPEILCVNPNVCDVTTDLNFSSTEDITQGEEVKIQEVLSNEDEQQKNNKSVGNILSCLPNNEDRCEESIPYDSDRGLTHSNSNCFTRLLDPSKLAVSTLPSTTNFFSISKDIVNGNYGLLFEDFYDLNIKGVPVVEALSKADDELMLYRYYTNDKMFVPSLKMIDCSYRPEYEKLEDWFCNYFFNILIERVSAEGEEVGKDYYEILKNNLISFRYSIDDTVRSLGSKKNREKYIGSNNINFLQLFFKKAIRNLDISPDFVDIAGKVFIPGSAMFFLELYSSLRDADILDKFQKNVESINFDDKVKLVNSPRVLLIPWPHQKEAFENWEKEERNGIIEMATATGKTLLGLMAIEAISKVKNHSTVRVFAHSTAILNQWKREVIEKLGLLSNIQESYIKPAYFNGVSVYFNTLQSVYKDPGLYPADLLIVDEVHHLAAQEYSKALDIKCEWKIGLSATVEGERLNILENKLGPVVYSFSLKEALEKGVLPKFDWKIHTAYLSIEEKTEFWNISKKIVELFNYVRDDHEFIKEASDGKIESVENLYDFIQVVEKARYRGKKLPENWKQLQLSIIQRRWIIHRSKPKIEDAVNLARKYLALKYKIIIFAMDIATCELIAQELEKEFENIFMVHSKLKENVNKQILNFKISQNGALIGARILDEGIDIPDAEIGINVSSSKTRLQLIQRIGRVLRMKEGKKPVFHHYIAIPEQDSQVKLDDNLVMIDDLSWIQDTALKIGVNAELISEEESLEKMRLEAEKMIRENYFKTRKTTLPSYGTLKVENILGTFPSFAINNIIDELSNLNAEHQISDTEWSDIVRKANGKKEDEPLSIPGYWWLLLLGDRNPVNVKAIFLRYKGSDQFKDSSAESLAF